MSSVDTKKQQNIKLALGICFISWTLFFVIEGAVFGQSTEPGVGSNRNETATWEYLALNRIKQPPLGLPKSLPATQRPATLDLIKLGRKLFFDPRLSFSNLTSCATCHVPAEAFTQNGVPRSKGRDGRLLRRNTPSLLNSVFYERLFLDGRETAFESLIISPLTHRNEMANPSVGWLLDKLRGLNDYQKYFQLLFGRSSPTIGDIGEALSAYQRSLLSANSKFDRWYFAGQTKLLSPKEVEGFKLFGGKADCQSCHQIGSQEALFTDQGFHDTGLVWKRWTVVAQNRSRLVDLGRFEITGNELDKWRIRTPGLRNIELTAPYMHDGSLKTLADVLDFYNRGGAPHSGQDVRIRPLNLSDSEIAAIISFLNTLTGDNISELIRSSRKISDE